MPKFATISNFFTIDGGGLYLGQAIISEQALYLAAALAPFTPVSLLTGGLGQNVSGRTGPLTVRLSELPQNVIGDPEWPVKTTDGYVYLLARESLTDIRCSLFGMLRLSNSEHSVAIRSGIIKRFAVLRTLRQFGWPI